ncbi:DNA-directed RNA polymerase [Psidium guajava]|nr:DNA-directed RNA polymerase [Psidium guajava]
MRDKKSRLWCCLCLVHYKKPKIVVVVALLGGHLCKSC